jgi:hypothetical protein
MRCARQGAFATGRTGRGFSGKAAFLQMVRAVLLSNDMRNMHDCTKNIAGSGFALQHYKPAARPCVGKSRQLS